MIGAEPGGLTLLQEIALAHVQQQRRRTWLGEVERGEARAGRAFARRQQ